MKILCLTTQSIKEPQGRYSEDFIYDNGSRITPIEIVEICVESGVLLTCIVVFSIMNQTHKSP